MTAAEDRTDFGVSQDALRKAEKLIEEEEGALNRLSRGFWAAVTTLIAVALALYHLYAAYGVVLPQVLRGIHVGGVLALATTNAITGHPPMCCAMTTSRTRSRIGAARRSRTRYRRTPEP